MNPGAAAVLFVYLLCGWIVTCWVLAHAYLNDEFYDDEIDWMGRVFITLLMFILWPAVFFIPKEER
jgi:hypothetical protein